MTKQYTNTREPGEFGDGVTVGQGTTDEAVGVNEDALRALAQAYDREDAAQRGEPDPWNLYDPGDIGDSDTWVSERLACARAAAEAFLSTLATEPAAPHELSGNTGELIDRMAEAIRGDTVCDDAPWKALSEDRKIGWRGDAERALAVVKEYLTAPRASSPSPKAVTITDEAERRGMERAAEIADGCHWSIAPSGLWAAK